MIPLAVLASELDQTVQDTAALVGDALHTDPASGIKVVGAHLCKHLIAAHAEQQAAQQAAQEQARRATAEAQAAENARQAAEYAAAEKVRQERAQRQRAILRDNPEMSALEVMLAADNDPDAQTPASRRFDEIIAANNRGDVGVMYKFTPTRHE